MINVVNFNEYKSKKNRVEDIRIATNYINNLNESSIEWGLLEILLNEAYDSNSLTIPMNYSSASRQLKVSENKIKKAYQNILDNKIIVELFKKPHRQTMLSVKNLILASDYVEEFKDIL